VYVINERDQSIQFHYKYNSCFNEGIAGVSILDESPTCVVHLYILLHDIMVFSAVAGPFDLFGCNKTSLYFCTIY